MTNHVHSTGPQTLNRSASTTETPENSKSDLTLDEIFSILSVLRRRATIEYLAQQDSPTSLSDIVDYVATKEFDKPLNDITSKERRSVYSSIHQTHLPRLHKHEVVDYRDPSSEIELDDNADVVLQYLSRATEASTMDRFRKAVKGFLSPSVAIS